jgi:hypothetical protein
MRWNRWPWRWGALPALLLACGCLPNQLLGPPAQPFTGAPGAPPAPPPAGPQGPPLVAPPAGPPPGGPPLVAVAHQEPASVQAANLAQQLAATRDENKVLAARVIEMQAQIDERTRALAAARAEVRSATEELARAREDVERWRRDVATLRERAQSAERENQATLRAMTGLLEKQLELLREPPRPAPPVPAPPAQGPPIVP